MNRKKITLWMLLCIAFPTFLFAQSNGLWQRVDQNSIKQDNVLESYTKVDKFETFYLNVNALKTSILQAPLRNNGTNTSVEINFPVSNNAVKKFSIYKVQTLSPGLSEKFPSITSYVGISKDKKNRIRLTLTNQGLYGMLSSTEGTIYINPYTKTGDIYTVFNRKDSYRSQDVMRCLVESQISESRMLGNTSNLIDVDESVLRNYELAVATTGEYSTFHVNQAGLQNGTDQEKKTAVLSAIAVTVDRVAEVYERDLAVTFELVPDNEDIIYLDPTTDPFQNGNASVLINQSQTEIDNTIGPGNYDIGHTFSTGAGGLAQLMSVCSVNKARGITGINAPVGDAYDIDFVAHEIGHQFGGNHTFNGDTGSCAGGNRNNATAVEPGSGSTIMAYAGICPGENVQNNSDPYFHAISIGEMYNFVSNSIGGNCPTDETIGNSAPVIIPGDDKTIPYGTAFRLTADATDADGDELTYTWEQTDTEITPAPPTPSATQGPVFRSRNSFDDPTRYFPEKTSVLANNLTPTWEVIPDVARTFNFAVTVRDNNVLGGQSSRDDVVINVANTGPFQVTSQATSGINYDQNETFEVTWDVAGTDANGINTSNVNILISYNAGIAFTEVLATNVPNTGSAMVQAPIGQSSSLCKIMIEPVDNVYYALNSTLFRITSDLSTEDVLASTFAVYPNPNNGSFTISMKENTSEVYTANVYDIRGRLIKNFEVNPSTSLEKRVSLDNAQAGIYLLELSNGKQKTVKKLVVN
ncbi:zinc-dependent metalloprotease [Haloflavibacter putidus]|uniref:T9SS type A sorting domain-containing protein n=1 Tax=Haloflavibacter putidus TaxID=2576776 RepID=A0A507ZQM8_9FLAO|nr:zinc-dependent metalloprotease [Haloflavibacter putidus]TQD40076.1 T9SS type A sorting domain-containing protein [Haloflavibacter putidus]